MNNDTLTNTRMAQEIFLERMAGFKAATMEEAQAECVKQANASFLFVKEFNKAKKNAIPTKAGPAQSVSPGADGE